MLYAAGQKRIIAEEPAASEYSRRLFGYFEEDYYVAEKASLKGGAIVNRTLYRQAGNSIVVPIFEQMLCRRNPRFINY